MNTKNGLSRETVEKIQTVLASFPEGGKSGALWVASEGQFQAWLGH